MFTIISRHSLLFPDSDLSALHGEVFFHCTRELYTRKSASNCDSEMWSLAHTHSKAYDSSSATSCPISVWLSSHHFHSYRALTRAFGWAGGHHKYIACAGMLFLFQLVGCSFTSQPQSYWRALSAVLAESERTAVCCPQTTWKELRKRPLASGAAFLWSASFGAEPFRGFWKKCGLACAA